MDLKLTQLNIQGFKSFGKEQQIRFGDITIFIGANGSGKSNLMSFFEMLQRMMDKKLEQYVAIHNGASFFTHLGGVKPVMCQLTFQSDTDKNIYDFLLAPTNANNFVFTGENLKSDPLEKNITDDPYSKLTQVNQGVNQMGKESGFPEFVNSEKLPYLKFTREVFDFLKTISPHKFNETSSNAAIRKDSYVNNTGFLMTTGGNLSAFLYGLQQSSFKKYYDRIVRNIKLAYPSFEDFVLTPNAFNSDNVRLDWRDKDCPPNFRFSPQQLSDGTLRFMALTALLLQPPETIPKVVVIDEPELGLHPSAISLLANMIYTAAPYSQIVLATQSAELLDYFEPEHIRVVEREGSNSIIKEPDSESLKYWLEEYSLGQIWEKNIIGGRP